MQPAGPSTHRFQPTHGLINGPIPPSLLMEASKFVKLVKEYKNKEVYYHLLQILKDYAEQRIDVGGTVWRIEQLVDDYSELREGVISLRREVKATNFIKKIEGRLTINDLKRYNEILEGFHSRQPSVVKFVEEMAVLFADHEDLFQEFIGWFFGLVE